MIRGKYNSAQNQRTYATVITAVNGFGMAFNLFPWTYPLIGVLTAGMVLGGLNLYVGIGLYRKWF